MVEYTGVAWSEQEDKFLVDNYRKISIKEIQKVLEWRTNNTIRKRANALRKEGRITGVTIKVWTIEEEKFLEENYLLMKPIELAEKLNVSVKQIYSKTRYMRDLGLLEGTNIKFPTITDKTIREREKELKRLDKRDAKIYKREIEREIKSRDYGIGRKILDFKFEKDKTYLLDIRVSEKNTKTFKGKLVQATHNHITFINSREVRESFLKNDFLLGEIKVKEIA